MLDKKRRAASAARLFYSVALEHLWLLAVPTLLIVSQKVKINRKDTEDAGKRRLRS
jgi:hypothetical protein